MSEEDDIGFESGPFCRHWDDTDCPEKCAKCGDGCWDHDDDECEWEDSDD